MKGPCCVTVLDFLCKVSVRIQRTASLNFRLDLQRVNTIADGTRMSEDCIDELTQVVHKSLVYSIAEQTESLSFGL